MTLYHLWSNKHSAWWRPNSQGYTQDVAEAGLYTEADAVARVVNSSQCGILGEVTCMVVAPYNWSEAIA